MCVLQNTPLLIKLLMYGYICLMKLYAVKLLITLKLKLHMYDLFLFLKEHAPV